MSLPEPAPLNLWNYKANGDDWEEIEPFCGIGSEQSPINISKEEAVSNSDMEINGYGYMNYPDGKFLLLEQDTIKMDFTDGEF